MATLTSPNITVAFIEKAASAITRGDRGIVMLVLRDASITTTPDKRTIRDVSEVPTTYSAANQKYIKDALKGYTTSPLKVLVYTMPVKASGDTAEDEAEKYTAMFAYLETAKFQWLAIPTVDTDEKTSDVVSWVKSQRNNNANMVKAVLPDANSADTEGIIGWAVSLYTVSGTTRTEVTPEEACPRIAGLLAGTGSTISATYAPLKDFDDVERLTKDERNTAIAAGKLIAFWDGEKVKLDRAITSLTTTTDTKGDSFKKIKLVEDMDMIKTDIQKTIEDDYIGKYANSYDNKCLLITAINGYFMRLAKDGIIEAGTCEIDIDDQRAYLISKGKKVVIDGEEIDPNDLTDDQVKVANTDSHVFLKSNVTLLDAIEDVSIKIYV